MEEPWTRLLVCPGALQRPQRVRQTAGDNADPDTGQLHGGHQLWVLVWRPTLQWEEADSLCSLYADERTVFQLTARLTDCTVWQHRLTDWLIDQLTVSDADYAVKAFRDDSGPAGHCTFGAHMPFCMCSWVRKQALRERKIYIYLQWHSTFMCWWWNFFLFFRLFFGIMASHLIWSFFDRHVKYLCYSTSPENLLPVFVGLGESYLNVSLHFPAFVIDVEGNFIEWTGVFRLNVAFAFITWNGFYITEIIYDLVFWEK